jgi:hypothetical protein
MKKSLIALAVMASACAMGQSPPRSNTRIETMHGHSKNGIHDDIDSALGAGGLNQVGHDPSDHGGGMGGISDPSDVGDVTRESLKPSGLVAGSESSTRGTESSS